MAMSGVTGHEFVGGVKRRAVGAAGRCRVGRGGPRPLVVGEEEEDELGIHHRPDQKGSSLEIFWRILATAGGTDFTPSSSSFSCS